MRHVKAISVLVLFVVLGSTRGSAQAAPLPQEPTPQAPTQQNEQAALVAQLAQASNGDVQVSYHAETGKVRFIGTDGQQPIVRAAGIAASANGEQAARGFLAQYGSVFGIRDQAQELRTLRTDSAERGTFTRFQQTYQGVPVFGAELRVHTTPDANVVSVNGEIVPDLAINTTPRLTAAEATAIATTALAKGYKVPAETFTATEPQLWIYKSAHAGSAGHAPQRAGMAYGRGSAGERRAGA